MKRQKCQSEEVGSSELHKERLQAIPSPSKGSSPPSWTRGAFGYLRKHPVLSPAPVAWHPRVPLWFVPRRGARHKSGPVRLPNRRKRWALWTRSLARERGDGPMAKRMGNGPVARRRLLDSRRRRSTQHAFNPTAGPVGALGNFGHWLGVSWVWAEGVVLVHVVYSISLPILLLRLAVPETVGKSLLGRRGIVSALVVLGVDVFILLLFVVLSQHFWMGCLCSSRASLCSVSSPILRVEHPRSDPASVKGRSPGGRPP